ncbi:hypothetical protein [Desertibaculum subflavum]|uniref:hypothetical protein n=1 Tax=Desertibaculum subflavum TaxID=2268458 RepID=UPI000E6602FF
MTWGKVIGGALALVLALIVLDKQGMLRAPPPKPRPAATVAAAPPAAVPGPAFRPTEETPDAFPDGNGRDEAFYLCTGCHGTALVKAQGMGRQQWDDTVSWMVEKHKMPEPDPATRGLVLDYLAAVFPPRAQQQRGWVNPFANR